MNLFGDPVLNDNGVAWLEQEQELLDEYFNLLIELASARSWSQIMFSTHWPHSFASVFHPNPRTAQQLLNHQRQIFQAILQAENVVYGRAGDNPLPLTTKKIVKTMLDGVAFNQLQLVREMYLVCERAGWDVNHADIKALAHRCFGAPFNTKYNLEDLFAHLSSVAKLSSLATPMNKPLGVLG